MIYNVARVRKLFAKFQVDTYKTKKDTSAHAQLPTLQLRSKTIYNVARVRRLSTKFQVDTCKGKEIDRSAQEQFAHLVVEIQAMIYSAARDRRLSTKFQVDTYKTKR